MAFDTLSYARRLKQAGMPEAQGEAVAEATRDAIAADAATKGDIERLEASTKAEFADVRHEIAALGTEPKDEVAARRTKPKSDMAAPDTHVTAAVDALVFRMTIQLGGIIAVGVAVLAAIIKL